MTNQEWPHTTDAKEGKLNDQLHAANALKINRDKLFGTHLRQQLIMSPSMELQSHDCVDGDWASACFTVCYYLCKISSTGSKLAVAAKSCMQRRE